MKVQETKIGNSIIEVYDDSIRKGEELEKLLKRYGIRRVEEREPSISVAAHDQKFKKKGEVACMKNITVAELNLKPIADLDNQIMAGEISPVCINDGRIIGTEDED